MRVCWVHTNGSIFHPSQIFSAKIIIFLDGFVAKFTALSSGDNPVFVWLPFLQLIPPSYLMDRSSDVGSYVLLLQFSDWLLINSLLFYFFYFLPLSFHFCWLFLFWEHCWLPFSFFIMFSQSYRFWKKEIGFFFVC